MKSWTWQQENDEEGNDSPDESTGQNESKAMIKDQKTTGGGIGNAEGTAYKQDRGQDLEDAKADIRMIDEKDQDDEIYHERLLHDIHRNTEGYLDVNLYDSNNAIKAIRIDFGAILDSAHFQLVKNPQATHDGNDHRTQHPFVRGIHNFLNIAKNAHGDEVTFT